MRLTGRAGGLVIILIAGLITITPLVITSKMDQPAKKIITKKTEIKNLFASLEIER